EVPPGEELRSGSREARRSSAALGRPRRLHSAAAVRAPGRRDRSRSSGRRYGALARVRERGAELVHRGDSMTKSRGILAPRHRWTEAEIELLLATYPDQTAQAVAAQLWPGCVPHHVHTKAKKLGLKKSEAFLASAASGRLDGVRGA